MTFDEMLTRTEGAIDLMRGKRDRGWARLDLSADGFWASFIAIPLCIPALLVEWLAHSRWLTALDTPATVPTVIGAMALIEVVNLVVCYGLLMLIAPRLGYADRIVPTIIAVNWGTVFFAYARAIPAALTLLIGVGEGVSFVTLVVVVITLIAYWRLLNASLARSALAATVAFLATLVIGYGLTYWGQEAFGLFPPAQAALG